MLDLIDNFEVPSYKVGETCRNFLFLNATHGLWQSANFDSRLALAIKAYNDQEEMKAEQELREPFLLQRFTAHILRHTACTRLSEQGMPATVLQRIMGHKNISMTMNVYNHSDQERLRQEMKRIDELRQNGTT